MAKISDFVKHDKPYDCDYLPIKDILDEPLTIMDAVTFTNVDGLEGVYFKFMFEEGISDDCYYCCTHSIGIKKILTDEKVQEAFANGEVLECRVAQLVSKKSGRNFYCLI